MIGLPYAGSGLVHGLFMGLDIVAGLALFAFEVRRRGHRDDRLWVIAGMCLALAAIASRVGTCGDRPGRLPAHRTTGTPHR